MLMRKYALTDTPRGDFVYTLATSVPWEEYAEVWIVLSTGGPSIAGYKHKFKVSHSDAECDIVLHQANQVRHKSGSWKRVVDMVSSRHFTRKCFGPLQAEPKNCVQK